MTNLTNSNSPDFSSLLGQLRGLIAQARSKALRAVDTIQAQTYWEIGRHIVEFEQLGQTRAEYGKRLLPQLAESLSQEFGKGFDASNLRYMRLFYHAFPIRDALRHELSWTHYRTLLRLDSEAARNWYVNESIQQNWSSRALERQQRKVTGLWAELWLISNSKQREVAVEAGHFDPMDRFDFAFDTHFIEVKATEHTERAHEFAYDQLRKNDRPTWVVSLKLRRAQNGLSISDLVDTVQLGLSSRLREKLVRNVFGAVGNAVSETTNIRFDPSFASSNLRFIRAEQIPVVLIPAGSPISSVRFRVNLDDSSMTSMLQTRSVGLALTLN
jgi:DUF1016 N-terminal domain/Putative  PD-(D/E)XK family member, (DUF4420)